MPRKPPEAVPPQPGEEMADRTEVLILLSRAARKGNVPAMKLLLEEMRRDGLDDEDEVTSVIDELARRREAAG